MDFNSLFLSNINNNRRSIVAQETIVSWLAKCNSSKIELSQLGRDFLGVKVGDYVNVMSFPNAILVVKHSEELGKGGIRKVSTGDGGRATISVGKQISSLIIRTIDDEVVHTTDIKVKFKHDKKDVAAIVFVKNSGSDRTSFYLEGLAKKMENASVLDEVVVGNLSEETKKAINDSRKAWLAAHQAAKKAEEKGKEIAAKKKKNK